MAKIQSLRGKVSLRGRRNEPAYTRLVAEKLAEVKNLPFGEVEAITTANAVRLFGLDESS